MHSLHLFEDAAFEAFRLDYLRWSATRRRNLQSYLSSTPNLFRVYLPYNDRIYQLAHQIIWYQDEVIVDDPILNGLGFINSNKVTPVMRKKALINNLAVLSRFRHAIESGYVLLKGDSLPTVVDNTFVGALLALPLIRETLESTIRYGYAKVPQEGGWRSETYYAELDASTIGSGVLAAGNTKVTVVRKGLPRVSREELEKLVGKPPFDGSGGLACLPGETTDFVIAGNHRDAWVRGAHDAGSGTISLLRAAQHLGERSRSRSST